MVPGRIWPTATLYMCQVQAQNDAHQSGSQNAVKNIVLRLVNDGLVMFELVSVLRLGKQMLDW